MEEKNKIQVINRNDTLKHLLFFHCWNLLRGKRQVGVLLLFCQGVFDQDPRNSGWLPDCHYSEQAAAEGAAVMCGGNWITVDQWFHALETHCGTMFNDL